MAKKVSRQKAKAAQAERNGTTRSPKADPNAAAGDELIDMNQAIALLKTSRPTFYRWLRSGKVKGMKVGRQWRFYRQDIERFLKGEEPRIDLPADMAPLIARLRQRLEEVGGEDASPRDASDEVRAVDLMIALSTAMRATDIHIAPHSKELAGDNVAVLRYRVDGVLHPVADIDKRLLPAIVARWKALAACNVHERMRPQDGRILVNAEGRQLDLRVCFLPACLGESVTVRVLDPDVIRLTLDHIHYPPKGKEKLLRWLGAPWGTIVVTGPTGSGKTTALYACVNEVAKPELKVMSVENPVEYLLPWVVQVQVRSDTGLTFGSALRSILRSDPDVVLVGEMRDRETLIIAQQIAITGHLVLTTLHADEAARALKRMVEMGGEPFVVGDATKLIVAQRLVRLLCPDCSEPYTPAAEALGRAAELARVGGLDWSALPENFRSPVGCPKCRKTGFRSRNVIAEVLEISPEIGEALRSGASVDELRAVAIREGMVTMAADGIRQAAEGTTTLDEVLRVTALR